MEKFTFSIRRISVTSSKTFVHKPGCRPVAPSSFFSSVAEYINYPSPHHHNKKNCSKNREIKQTVNKQKKKKKRYSLIFPR